MTTVETTETRTEGSTPEVVNVEKGDTAPADQNRPNSGPAPFDPYWDQVNNFGKPVG